MRAALITISTSKADGEGIDESGPKLAELAESIGCEIAGAEVIPDDWDEIAERLRHYCDEDPCDLVLTSGGTGFAPSDVTPEATREVIERHAPGLAEAMRGASAQHTGNWMLSRAVAGIRTRTLIINFPGNPAAIEESAEAIVAALPHALELLRGDDPPH